MSILFFLLSIAIFRSADMQVETFDRDPNWDGKNNRPGAGGLRTITQDFGYAPKTRIGDSPGAIGGTICPDGQAAYYAKRILTADFDTPLRASGILRMEKGGGNILLGFFNSETINEWRTPNTLVFRINGRGETFHVHIEYATRKWRAGASVIGRHDYAADRVYPVENPSNAAYRWSLVYDPAGNNGAGAVTATFNDQKAAINLTPEHRADGAQFNRFGLLNVVKSADDAGRLWLGDLSVNGEPVDLTCDPGWEALRNRVTYESADVRPRFDFGFSPTHYANGLARGEMGGLVFRGDCRYPERMAYYGATLHMLTLAKPLRASGKLTLRRAVSDSTTLVGFFHAQHSLQVNPSQKFAVPADFLGFSIEGPSSQGFYVYPTYRVHGEGQSRGPTQDMPRIYPDGASHEWTLEYLPGGPNTEATITLTLDHTSARIIMPAEDVAAGAQFNRFGLVTTWIDGNGQVVYLDDLSFTAR